MKAMIAGVIGCAILGTALLVWMTTNRSVGPGDSDENEVVELGMHGAEVTRPIADIGQFANDNPTENSSQSDRVGRRSPQRLADDNATDQAMTDDASSDIEAAKLAHSRHEDSDQAAEMDNEDQNRDMLRSSSEHAVRAAIHDQERPATQLAMNEHTHDYGYGAGGWSGGGGDGGTLAGNQRLDAAGDKLQATPKPERAEQNTHPLDDSSSNSNGAAKNASTNSVKDPATQNNPSTPSDVNAAALPEPASIIVWALLSGLAFFVLSRRRR